LVNPEKIYKLSLRVNEIPEEMRQFKNLQSLDLNQSSWIKKMPESKIQIMAGPVILICTKHFDENTHLKLANMLKNSLSIDDVNETNDSYDVHIKKGKFGDIKLNENSCTFLINIERKEHLDQTQQQNYLQKLQLKNSTGIHLAAMCNQSIDHFLLAKLAIEIQKITGGFIDMNGRICPKGYPIIDKYLQLVYPPDEII
jgi:Family of unknown function (DUF6368)